LKHTFKHKDTYSDVFRNLKRRGVPRGTFQVYISKVFKF